MRAVLSDLGNKYGDNHIWVFYHTDVNNNNLFALNSERHNYNTRQTHHLQINAGRGEIFNKLFSYHGQYMII